MRAKDRRRNERRDEQPVRSCRARTLRGTVPPLVRNPKRLAASLSPPAALPCDRALPGLIRTVGMSRRLASIQRIRPVANEFARSGYGIERRCPEVRARAPGGFGRYRHRGERLRDRAVGLGILDGGGEDAPVDARNLALDDQMNGGDPLRDCRRSPSRWCRSGRVRGRRRRVRWRAPWRSSRSARRRSAPRGSCRWRASWLGCSR